MAQSRWAVSDDDTTSVRSAGLLCQYWFVTEPASGRWCTEKCFVVSDTKAGTLQSKLRRVNAAVWKYGPVYGTPDLMCWTRVSSSGDIAVGWECSKEITCTTWGLCVGFFFFHRLLCLFFVGGVRQVEGVVVRTIFSMAEFWTLSHLTGFVCVNGIGVVGWGW